MKNFRLVHVDFPENFREIVNKQQGEGYDRFEKLEGICKPKEGTAVKELKEANGI